MAYSIKHAALGNGGSGCRVRDADAGGDTLTGGKEAWRPGTVQFHARGRPADAVHHRGAFHQLESRNSSATVVLASRGNSDRRILVNSSPYSRDSNREAQEVRLRGGQEGTTLGRPGERDRPREWRRKTGERAARGIRLETPGGASASAMESTRFGIDKSWTNGIHGNAMRSEFLGECLRKPDYSEFE